MTDIAEAEALQEGMETGTVIRLLEVTQFVEEDVVAERFWKTDKIKVQINVAGTGTASPVGRIMLDGHLVKMESILVGKIRKFLRQKDFRFLTKHLDKDIPKGLLRNEIRRRESGRHFDDSDMGGLVEAEPQAAAVLRIVNDRGADLETESASRSRVRRQDWRNLSGRMENNLGQEGTHDKAIMNLRTGIDLFLLPQRLTNPVPAGIEIINAILQGAGIRDSYRNAAACPPFRSTDTDTD